MMFWYQTCDNQLSKQMVIFYLNPMVPGDSQNIEVFKNKSFATDNDINAVVWNEYVYIHQHTKQYNSNMLKSIPSIV